MCAGVPLATELDFTDVGSVGQDRVQLAATEFRSRWQPADAFLGQSVPKRIERVIVVSVKLEDSPDFGSIFGVKLDNASTVDSDVAVAVGSLSNEEARFDPSQQPIFHIE